MQPMLVHDEGSLALGRTQTYGAVFGTAGESEIGHLQPLTAWLRVPTRIFRIVMG